MDKESTVGAWYSERRIASSSKTRRRETFERSIGLKMTRPCDRDRWTVERKSPEKRDLETLEPHGEAIRFLSSAVLKLLDFASGYVLSGLSSSCWSETDATFSRGRGTQGVFYVTHIHFSECTIVIDHVT